MEGPIRGRRKGAVSLYAKARRSGFTQPDLCRSAGIELTRELLFRSLDTRGLGNQSTLPLGT